MAPPMRTCPALRGWRRCGKRSPAPRVTPKTIILSENRWFSRCSRCSRKRRGKRPVSYSNRSVRADYKDFRRGQEVFEKEKDREGRQARRQGRDEEACREQSEEGRQESRKERRKEGHEK